MASHVHRPGGSAQLGLRGGVFMGAGLACEAGSPGLCVTQT